ncbi:MAG: penicillin acylase family protein, partial [Ktedonobacterales bacterium]
MQTTQSPAAAQSPESSGKGAAKKPRRRILGILGQIAVVGAIIVVLLAILLTSAGIFMVQRSLPQTAGTLNVPGLHGRVTVMRDQWGVPHIQGDDLHDTIFAQGYVTAQDRLFQMEFNRRVAAGRLAELFGAGDNNSLIKADEFLRTLGLYRAAGSEFASLDPRTHSEIQAYSDGVNAFLT